MLVLIYFSFLIHYLNLLKKSKDYLVPKEELLKNDIKYKVNKETITNIKNKIKDIIKCLRIKIIIFIIFEFFKSIFILKKL